MNSHPDVSQAVRERVLRAIDELHYVPNTSARDLVCPQTDLLGVVVRGAENPFFTPVIRAAEETAEAAGYAIALHQIKPGEDEILAGASLARSKRLKGLILLGGSYDYTAERAAALPVPFVCCTFTNSFGSMEQGAFSSVSIDDRAEARRAVGLLAERGHRRIAMLLDSVSDHSISQLRYQGYCQALEAAGIPLDGRLVWETVNYDMASAYEVTKRRIAENPDVTALFVIADAMAIAALKALHESARRVPEDVSVIAIDGIDMSAYTIPTLTTLVQPQAEMGHQAVNILLDMLERQGGNRHVLLETALRPGGTLAPCVRTERFSHPPRV